MTCNNCSLSAHGWSGNINGQCIEQERKGDLSLLSSGHEVNLLAWSPSGTENAGEREKEKAHKEWSFWEWVNVWKMLQCKKSTVSRRSYAKHLGSSLSNLLSFWMWERQDMPTAWYHSSLLSTSSAVSCWRCIEMMMTIVVSREKRIGGFFSPHLILSLHGWRWRRRVVHPFHPRQSFPCLVLRIFAIFGWREERRDEMGVSFLSFPFRGWLYKLPYSLANYLS